MPHDVFISYSSMDKEIAERTCEVLELNGFKCWIAPRNIDAGKGFKDQIINAINTSKSFVLIFSKNCQKSHYTLKEVEVAFSRGIPIIVFFIEDIIPEGNFEFYLKSAQFVNAPLDNLVEAFKKLTSMLNSSTTIGIDKPTVLPKGAVKTKIPFRGKTITHQKVHSISPYVYLSYDEADFEFINSQISQYKNQRINFKYINLKNIDDASLMIVFISQNSHKSSKIKKDVKRAISNNVGILLIYLDDVEINFGGLFNLRYKSKFEDAIKFTIERFNMDELSYIDRCSEIFELYGVKKNITEDKQEEYSNDNLDVSLDTDNHDENGHKLPEENSMDYLDYLIKDSNDISLSESISTAGSSKGIDITDDNLIIDGKHHHIAVSDVDYVFKINSKNVILKNLDFTECRLNDASSIIKLSKDSSLTLKNCSFFLNDACLISNLGEIQIENSKFTGNNSKESLISSKGRLFFKSSTFEYNNSGVIFNEGNLEIKYSAFTENKSSNMVYNIGKLHFEMCSFYDNEANENIIFNQNESSLFECNFRGNSYDVIVLNSGKLVLNDSKFVENVVFKATLFNNNVCDVTQGVFATNILNDGYEIYNEGRLTFENIEFIIRKILNHGRIGAYGAHLEDIEGNDIEDNSEGIVKKKTIVEGIKKPYSYIYLSYDDSDLEFVSTQINQFENQEINFTSHDPFKIIFSALIVVFISEKSYQSLKIENDIKKAISYNKRIVLIYLDNVRCDFENLLDNSIVYSINYYGLSQLEYIERYTEIFQLFGIKTAESQKSKEIQVSKIIDPNAFTVSDLENLVQTSNEITLTDDINVNDSSKGIGLKADNLIIDGNGRSISLDGADYIFNIVSGNILLKNINFKDCNLDNTSSIINVNEGASLKLDSCRFKSNNLEDGHILNNSGSLMIENCEFLGNNSQNNLILNEKHLKLINSLFNENYSQDNAPIIYNKGELMMADNEFVNNCANSLINNIGEFYCTTCSFLNHKMSGNLVNNDKNGIIEQCIFEYNILKTSILNNGVLTLIKSKFINNQPKNGYDICNNGQLSIKHSIETDKKIFNNGEIFADRLSAECIDGLGATSMTTGLDKPLCQPEGIVNPESPLQKTPGESSEIYLSYDDADLEFIQSQIDQFESEGIDVTNIYLKASALMVVFISKNSYQSSKIENDINEAVSLDQRILLIYLDNVRGDFEDRLKDCSVYSINHYDLSELEYRQKYSEYFNLFGIKSVKNSEKSFNEIKAPQITPDNAMTFEEFENLIQTADKITLTSDIHLIGSESSRYEKGITLNRDNLLIDGDGHSIFAKDINRIFNIKAGNVTLKDLNFKYLSLSDDSSAVYLSEDSSLTLIKCNFKSNDFDDGHAIYSIGDLNIQNSIFELNQSKNEGPAIYARAGSLKILNSKFKDNSSKNSGGAILNWAKASITECIFENNFAEGYGGAIGNVIDAVLNVKSTDFINNHAVSDASAIYNENRADCSNCRFKKHTSKLNIIFNENIFKLFNCNFIDNESRIIVQNNENGVLYLSNSKFIENKVDISNIYNNGESAGLEKLQFKDNHSANRKAVNIYNETYMRLREPKAEDFTIFNTGHIDLWKYNPEVINGEGGISKMDGPCDKKHSFTWLDNEIAENDIILLENDIRLENCELDFYEGGIELKKDGMTIDGQGHYIDGAKRSAIFLVLAKDITLKNIIFKNASLINDFTKHTSGGSAIRTATDSDLKVIDCEFKDNFSDDDGGAILNRSRLSVINSRFKHNHSKTYAGAICNKNTLFLKDNEFQNNSSRIRQDVLNLKKIKGNYDENYVLDIYQSNDYSKSLSYLADKIKESDNIILKSDIRFDYRTDKTLNNGIEITDVNLLTVDGEGFQIDAKNRSSLFRIKNSKVIFKNITFKNAYSYDSPIFENDGELVFENCRFINNRATSTKCMILNNVNVKLKNCHIINNISNKESLISNNGQLEIIDCEFALNSNEKSVISNNKKIVIEGTIFENNHADGNAAVIVNNRKSQIRVIKSQFKSNSTSSSGGAIINNADIEFLACDFETNSADGDGGVINNEKGGNIKIKDCTFKNNSSRGDGGALINWGNLIFENTLFIENTARKDGGVVNVQKGSLKISSCDFKCNYAFDGSSVFNRGDLEIVSSLFENNSAKKDGGVLNSYDGNIKILDSLFKANKAADGGVLYSREGNVVIRNSKFIDNSSEINGGAIIKWCEMTIENSILENNIASIYGGAINSQKEMLKISDSVLTKNSADVGGAVFNIKKDKLEIENCKFEDNSPDDIYWGI